MGRGWMDIWEKKKKRSEILRRMLKSLLISDFKNIDSN